MLKKKKPTKETRNKNTKHKKRIKSPSLYTFVVLSQAEFQNKKFLVQVNLSRKSGLKSILIQGHILSFIDAGDKNRTTGVIQKGTSQQEIKNIHPFG